MNAWAAQCRLRARGFTLLELLVVIAIVGTLGAVAIDRLLLYQELAEKAAMEQTVSTLRSALRLQVAERLLRSGYAELPALARMNPMDWLAQVPANYVEAHGKAAIPAGSWYFDAAQRQLVYLPRRRAHLDSGGAGRAEIRFETRVLRKKSAQEQSLMGDGGEVEGVILVPVRPYRWF